MVNCANCGKKFRFLQKKHHYEDNNGISIAVCNACHKKLQNCANCGGDIGSLKTNYTYEDEHGTSVKMCPECHEKLQKKENELSDEGEIYDKQMKADEITNLELRDALKKAEKTKNYVDYISLCKKEIGLFEGDADQLNNDLRISATSFRKELKQSTVISFIKWPIAAFIFESLFVIIYFFIIGLISHFLLGVDITSEGTPMATIIEKIMYPGGHTFFWVFLPWTYYKITLLGIVMFSVCCTYLNKLHTEAVGEQLNHLDIEKSKLKKELERVIQLEQKRITKEHKKQEDVKRKFEVDQSAKGLIKYIDRRHDELWGTPEEVKRWKEVEIGLSNNFAEISPFEFEQFIAELFQRMGYETQVTRKTGDYGVDVVAERDNDCVAIQVKKYNSGTHVGAVDVQKVLGAMWKYKATHAIIVTTSFFTIQAKDQSREAPVELWDKHELHNMVRKYFIDER